MSMKRLNLLPKELRPKTGPLSLSQLQQMFQYSPTFRLAVLAVALLALVPIGQEVTIWKYRFGLTQLDRQLKQARTLGSQLKVQQEGLKAQRADLLMKRQQLEIRQQTMLHAHQSKIAVSTILAELVEALPTEVSVTNLSYNGALLKIVGNCPGIQSVGALMNRLDKSNRFYNTSFTYTQRVAPKTGTGFTFEISTVPALQLTGAPG